MAGSTHVDGGYVTAAAELCAQLVDGRPADDAALVAVRTRKAGT